MTIQFIDQIDIKSYDDSVIQIIWFIYMGFFSIFVHLYLNYINDSLETLIEFGKHFGNIWLQIAIYLLNVSFIIIVLVGMSCLYITLIVSFCNFIIAVYVVF